MSGKDMHIIQEIKDLKARVNTLENKEVNK